MDSTVTKAIDVLFHLHERQAPTGVTAIAEALAMPKASVHRLLRALASRGLVERVDRGRYVPGVALIALGLGALRQDPVVAIARPELEAGAERLGETFFLATARARSIVVLDRAEGGGVLRAAPPIGRAVPVHATAMGRLYLAYAPDRVDAPGPPYEAFTPSTRVDPAELEAEVALARERGWATNRSEWIPGLVVSAAPVLVDGEMHAAVAAAAPAARTDERAEHGLVEAVVEVAAAVGDRLRGDLR